MKKILFLFTVLLFVSSTASAVFVGEEVSYESDGVTLKGYIAYDNEVQNRPGILVVHEWWGHNAYARRRANMLAELGYTALAVDMYGDGKQAEHLDDAGAFATVVNKNMQSVGKSRFLAALDVLKSHSSVDSEKMAAIGYCFGGGTVLHMARFGVDLDGVASFHGSLSTETPAQKDQVKARVLVLHGADDPFIPAEQVEAFKKEMEDAGVDYKFVAYEGAVHSFSSPDADVVAEKFGLPLKYNKEADEKSWEEMKTFFEKIFK